MCRVFYSYTEEKKHKFACEFILVYLYNIIWWGGASSSSYHYHHPRITFISHTRIHTHSDSEQHSPAFIVHHIFISAKCSGRIKSGYPFVCLLGVLARVRFIRKMRDFVNKERKNLLVILCVRGCTQPVCACVCV